MSWNPHYKKYGERKPTLYAQLDAYATIYLYAPDMEDIERTECDYIGTLCILGRFTRFMPMHWHYNPKGTRRYMRKFRYPRVYEERFRYYDGEKIFRPDSYYDFRELEKLRDNTISELKKRTGR